MIIVKVAADARDQLYVSSTHTEGGYKDAHSVYTEYIE